MDSLSGSVTRLLRRRWYVVAAALVLGAAGARTLDSTKVVSSDVVHVASVADAAKTLDLKDVPDAPAEAVALQAPEAFKRSPDFAGLSATFNWDDLARSLSITVTGSSSASVRAGAIKVRDVVKTAVLQPVDASLALAAKDQTNQVDQLNAAAAAIDKTVQDLPPNDSTRSAFLSRAADLRTDAAKAAIRGSSLESLRTLLPSLVTSLNPSVATSSPGPTTYITGILVASVLVILGACGWALADRRIRRRSHVERAAPSVRSLGLIGPVIADAPHIDSVIIASLRAFVRDNGLTSIAFFGVPTAHRSVTLLATALQESIGIPLVASDQSAAETVRHDSAEPTGYVAVVRWGKTTEDQLASAIADVRSVDGLAIATILIGVPESERNWAGAPAPDADYAVGEGS
jgi:hypothetical protein